MQPTRPAYQSSPQHLQGEERRGWATHLVSGEGGESEGVSQNGRKRAVMVA